MFWLIVLNSILMLFALFFVWQFYNIFFRGYAPFISSKSIVVQRIIEALESKDDFAGKKIFELGCGRAPFLQEFAKKYPGAKLVGIEYAFLPYVIAKIQITFRRKKNFKIIKRDLYHANIGEADMIYCYLNEKMMKDLEKKFKFECKMKTAIISHCFPVPNFIAEKIIEIPEIKVKKGYENKIYIYKI